MVEKRERVELPERPARPDRPQMVPAKEMPSLDSTPLPKEVYMLHNLAHIELNAVDLAWDTLVKTNLESLRRL